MSTHLMPFDASHPRVPGDPGLGIQSVAQLVAAAVCGVHRVNGQFISVSATLGDDGYINVEATRMDFTGENSTVRVLFYPTAPVPVPSRSLPDPTGAA
jgi:hypothetical protein